MAAPVLAIATVLAAVAAYPGFNHATQYISELGGAKAARPEIFNFGIMLSGLAAMAAGVGYSLVLVEHRRPISGVFIALCFIAGGIGLIGAAIFPWPDRRHMVISLGLGIQLAPLLLIWGLRGAPERRRLRWFLMAVFLAMMVLTVFTKHLVLPGTVNDANVGWWERVFAFVLVSWVGVAAWMLDRAPPSSSPGVVETQADAIGLGPVSGHFVSQPALPEKERADGRLDADEASLVLRGVATPGGRGHHQG